MKYVGECAPAWSFGNPSPLRCSKEDVKMPLLRSKFRSILGSSLDRFEGSTKSKSGTNDDIFRSINRKSGFTFSKNKRNREIVDSATEKVPGPGSYDVGYHDLARKSKPFPSNRIDDQRSNRYINAYETHMAAKSLLEKGGDTEDNTHTIAYRATQGLGVSMPYRYDSKPDTQTSDTVGPGSYNIKRDILKPNAIIFSKGYKVRESVSCDKIYDSADSLDCLRKPRSKVGTIGRARRILENRENRPEIGPTTYETISIDWGRTQGGLLGWPDRDEISKDSNLNRSVDDRFMKIKETPGPMDYDVKVDFTKSKANLNVHFNKAQRFQRDLGSTSEKVGPGSYTRNIFDRITKGMGWKEPKKDKLLEYIPGPGDYDIKSELKDTSHKWIVLENMTYSIKPDKSVFNVGPGGYNPNKDSVLPNKKILTIGTVAKPFKVESQKSPGVGSYDISTKSIELDKKYHKGTTFGHAKRSVDEEIPYLSPGPGYYTLKPTVPAMPPYDEVRMIKEQMAKQLVSKLT